MPESYTVDTAAEMQSTYQKALGNALQQLGENKTPEALSTLEQGVLAVYTKGLGLGEIPNSSYANQVGQFLTPLREAIAKLGGQLPLNAGGLEVIVKALKPIEGRVLGAYMSNIHLTETDLTEQENAEVRSLLTGETEAVRKNVFTQIVARRIEQKLQRAPEATP